MRQFSMDVLISVKKHNIINQIPTWYFHGISKRIFPNVYSLTAVSHTSGMEPVVVEIVKD